MTVSEKLPITVKKYANRRLYNTDTSTYVTLEDLALMVKGGEDFTVYDAKSGEDITRSVLTQIIFEQEGKGGQSLLPTTFLRQLIRFYGDSMQMVVPSYLEFSIAKLTSEQSNFRQQIESSFGADMLPGQSFRSQMFEQIEEQTRKNMKLFSQAMSMFNPFVAPATAAEPAPPTQSEAPPDELEAIKRDISEMQRRLDRIVTKE